MHTKSRNLILASGMSLALATFSGTAAAGTASQDVTDARQETQIWTTYALNSHLRANDLKVSVHDGKATLSGKVEESVSKDLAKQIALGVDGVKEVDNQIVVQDGYAAPAKSSGRSYGDAVDDSMTTAAVKSKLMWNKHSDGLATDVETKSGKVTLSGTADSEASRDVAGRLAKNTRGVVSVDNKLVVNGKKSGPAEATRSAAHEAGQEVADSWITTKVKSTLLYSSNVDGSDIAVSTGSGIVTLSGKVDSGAEQALAVELAQDVRGVKSVDSKGLTL